MQIRLVRVDKEQHAGTWKVRGAASTILEVVGGLPALSIISVGHVKLTS